MLLTVHMGQNRYETLLPWEAAGGARRSRKKRRHPWLLLLLLRFMDKHITFSLLLTNKCVEAGGAKPKVPFQGYAPLSADLSPFPFFISYLSRNYSKGGGNARQHCTEWQANKISSHRVSRTLC